MDPKRRAFLKWQAGALIAGPALWTRLAIPGFGGALAGVSGCSDESASLLDGLRPSGAQANLILGGGKYQDRETGRIEHVFSIVDLDARRVELIPLDFLPHGIHQHARSPHLLAVFEKKGPHAALIDLESRQRVRPIETDPSRYFYGHGAYSVDGQHLFATETYLDGLKGILAIRDAQTHAFLGEFPSYGLEPHECKLIDGGQTLVVTNGGGSLGSGHPQSRPTVAYIDVATQQLLERVPLTNARINTGHSAIGSDGALVVASAPRKGLGPTETGGVSIRPRGGAMQTIEEPRDVTDKMQGEALSVAIHPESGIAAVTHPDGGMVTFWSTRDRRLLHSVELPHPRGVTLTSDHQSFVISYGETTSLLRLDAESFAADTRNAIPNTMISGSHLYNWSRELTEILAPRDMPAA